MTKAQLAVIWMIGLLVSGLLFYIGIGKPYLVSQGPGPVRAVASPLEMLEWHQAKTPHYYVGGLAPILVLGTCAFLTTLRKKS